MYCNGSIFNETDFTYERPLKWVEIKAIRKWLEKVYSFLIYVIIIFVDISFDWLQYDFFVDEK